MGRLSVERNSGKTGKILERWTDGRIISGRERGKDKEILERIER